MTPDATATATTDILLTPGPTAVPPRVLQELARPIIHHRTAAFGAIFKELSAQLQRLCMTAGPVLCIAGSGTTSFEAAQVSLAKPGSTVIAVAGGKFGERWQTIFDCYAKALNLNVVKIDHPWGEPAPVDRIDQALRDHPGASAVTVVHSETSTATASDVRAIAELTQKTDALLLVDGITSVGAFDCEMDNWGIDGLVTGSQKALMLPPGLGYVALGPRALARLKDTPVGPSYNLDLRRWVASWEKGDVPFTPPVSLIRAQQVALDMIEETGLERTIDRTLGLAQGARAAFKAMGLKLISSSPSPSVTGAYYPSGVDDGKFRAALRDKHHLHIAGGQDGKGAKWKGKVFRISHMGFVDAQDTRAGLQAIEAELKNAGAVSCETGTAVAAFDQARE